MRGIIFWHSDPVLNLVTEGSIFVLCPVTHRSHLLCVSWPRVTPTVFLYITTLAPQLGHTLFLYHVTWGQPCSCILLPKVTDNSCIMWPGVTFCLVFYNPKSQIIPVSCDQGSTLVLYQPRGFTRVTWPRGHFLHNSSFTVFRDGTQSLWPYHFSGQSSLCVSMNFILFYSIVSSFFLPFFLCYVHIFTFFVMYPFAKKYSFWHLRISSFQNFLIFILLLCFCF
jgi:hypothetical protein